MSKPIEIYDFEDLPCYGWDDKDCPMDKKYEKGESRLCSECGWVIDYL